MQTSKQTGTASAQLPSPPASPPALPSLSPSSPPTLAYPEPTISSLTIRLDALLTSYLTLLDTYSTLRSQLSSDLSSGFLSLAAANRNAASTLGPGRRFGEEGFDGRMRALRRVGVARRSAEEKYERESGVGPGGGDGKDLKGTAFEEEAQLSDDLEPAADEDLYSLRTLRYTIDATPPATTSSNPNADATEPTSPPPQSRDPLNWYTALPPLALRQTQQHFIAALSPVAALLNVSNEMTELEERVCQARTELEAVTDAAAVAGGEPETISARTRADRTTGEKDGTEGDRGHSEEDEDAELDSPGEERQGESSPLQASSASLLKGQLASQSRGAEPRSRVLKMQ